MIGVFVTFIRVVNGTMTYTVKATTVNRQIHVVGLSV